MLAGFPSLNTLVAVRIPQISHIIVIEKIICGLFGDKFQESGLEHGGQLMKLNEVDMAKNMLITAMKSVIVVKRPVRFHR